jgi:hypothetical protein
VNLDPTSEVAAVLFRVPEIRTPVTVDVMVSVGDGENIDNAVKRFKREVSKPLRLVTDPCQLVTESLDFVTLAAYRRRCSRPGGALSASFTNVWR